MKLCLKCGQSKPLTDFHKHRARNDGYATWCKECRKIFDQNHKTDERAKALFRECYKARNIRPLTRATRLYQYAKRRADDREQPFTLTLERIQMALLVGCCERTGISFSFNMPSHGHKVDPFAPSVDKVDPFGTYSDDNVQIVCWTYNMGKQQMTQEVYENFILTAADEIRRKRGLKQ